jgi:hypothetical protein
MWQKKIENNSKNAIAGNFATIQKPTQIRRLLYCKVIRIGCKIIHIKSPNIVLTLTRLCLGHKAT